MSKNKSPKAQPANQPTPTPAPTPVTTPEPTPVTTPEPTPILNKEKELEAYLKGQYEKLVDELETFRLLIKYDRPTLRERVETMEKLRQSLKTISGLTVTLVTAHGTDWNSNQFSACVDSLKSNYQPTLKVGKLDGDHVFDDNGHSFVENDWPSWNSMVEFVNLGFNPQAVRRLLVMNGLRWETSTKVERTKKEGNQWGTTLKSFKAWVVTTDTPSLSIWDRLVPSVDKIPQNPEGLEKLKKAYASLADLGF
jgi:hypothetical protein